MKKSYFSVLFFLMFSPTTLLAQGTFDEDYDLKTAVNNSTDGGEFIVKNGTYNHGLNFHLVES